MDVCRGAIALSPGLDYRGVKPESALVDGLADRTALLVASQNDASSSTAIRQMFLNAKGDVSARACTAAAPTAPASSTPNKTASAP